MVVINTSKDSFYPERILPVREDAKKLPILKIHSPCDRKIKMFVRKKGGVYGQAPSSGLPSKKLH